MLSEQPAPSGVALAVGPEGGWSDADRERARAKGYRPARLGPRVLRTEVAGAVALAFVQLAWGDLR
jgi:16S rRNA (uracil1498-N3)-methyltransferase